MKCQAQYFVTFLAVAYLCNKRGKAMPATKQCGKISVEKRNDLLRSLSLGNRYLHWSFSLLPSLQQGAKEELPHASESVKKMARETFIYGEHKRICAKKFKPGMKLCPVHYVLEYDENRIPENIVHVRCNCKYCSQNNSSRLTGKCEKEYAFTPVLRRTEGECEYKHFVEPVAVACTCKMHKIRTILAGSGIWG